MDESQSGMSICQPLTKHRPLYSYKNLMPGKVNMSLDNKPVTFSDKGFGIIDDHKGYYPKTVNYDWGTAGTYINNKLTGFNLTRNQVLNPEQFNENCLWLDGKVWALPAITVSHEKHSWHYTDVAGMVDLHFTELVPNSQKFHLGFVYMDYQGPFGLFNGVIHHPEVGAVEFKNVLGMAERKRYKL